LEEDALVFNLRADHDEESGDNQPIIVEKHTADHGHEGQCLSQAGGRAACGSETVPAGKASTNEAAEV